MGVVIDANAADCRLLVMDNASKRCVREIGEGVGTWSRGQFDFLELHWSQNSVPWNSDYWGETFAIWPTALLPLILQVPHPDREPIQVRPDDYLVGAGLYAGSGWQVCLGGWGRDCIFSCCKTICALFVFIQKELPQTVLVLCFTP